MEKVLLQIYQNYTKTFLVKCRSQSKAKNARTSATHNGVTPVGKPRKEMKPIIIDDNEPTIIDLDTKSGIDTQARDATVTKTLDKPIRQSNRGILYPEPIARPLPKPPELIDKSVESKQSVNFTPNVDFDENSYPSRRHYLGNVHKSRSILL